MIKVDSVCKNYSRKKNSKPQLDNVSCSFETNKISGLIGANGAGKSTFLKILSGQLYKTSGRIEIDGTELTFENDWILKNKIGYVSENPEFFLDQSVNELLKNTIEFYTEKSEFLEKYQKIVKQCSLEKVLNKKIKTLSKGYKQRLSFALALANDPEILILDEPISGLDPVQIQEIRNLILSLKENRTIILSTHIMQEAEICDKIFILDEGSLVAQGSKQELCTLSNTSNLEDAFFSLTGKSK